MKEITVRALVAAATYSFLLLGFSMLAGCAPAKYIFHCTVTQAENCN